MPAGSRLTPDPAVAVGDLMKAFENAFNELGSRDLSGLLRLDRFASSSTWKTTAPLDALCERGAVSLMQGLFRVCSNGVIQSSKLKTCLSKLQSEQGRVNFSKFSDSDFFDTCDSYIRQLAANWRSIKSDCGAYGRAVRKSSPAEKDIIDNMLTFLNLDDKNKAPAAADDRQQPKGSHEAEVSEPPAAGSAEVSASSSAFRRVLAKKDSEAQAAVVAVAQNEAVAAAPKLRRSLAEFFMDKDEEEELAEWMLQDVSTEKATAPKRKPSKKPASSTKSRKPKAKAKVQAVAAVTVTCLVHIGIVFLW